ncbi:MULTISPECIES: aa3-type cytochrome c oxidase subunit IV [Sphingobium]|uniref:Cytochrome C oxidase subunit IV n=1 Tax=Sphingobium chungbukense TaxID=56193 RepID=A0A0M3AN42_9SPHN|nr:MULTISPECIES: aa3-type cytochrome c oxidase subunit IV [Sphingobium]KKW91250.1 cytochrome C oxidase subunit IV [Sphingobium chungbukense]PJG47556.1 aa3-type cytochrome c oxidase subunit IV [Sphingobium sp. LB126]
MASEGNIESANQTYAGFLSLMKWGTIASALVAALVVVLIAHGH